MRSLGTFGGVFVPSFEAILGAVLFLVLPYLVGAAGLGRMMLVVLLANSATLATAFSIADTATNLRSVGSGGMYAISRRSLGMAFGGSIGIQLYLAQAISIGFYCIGFAEPLAELLLRVPVWERLTAGLEPLRQRQLLATIVACIAFVAGMIGTDFISRLQLFIFIVLCIAVAALLATPLLAPTKGGAPIFSTLGRALPNGGVATTIGFWAAFTIFFPAVTGIDAGVGMSGLLRNPRRALPRGTFAAIGVTLLIYVAVAVLFGRMRPDLLQPTEGGLPSSVAIFSEAPIIRALLLVGILVATGSSALSYFVTAPRTAQALVSDNVLPRFMAFLGRDFSASGSEPRWATLLTLAIVLLVIWSGDIAFASLIVGISFLVVYGWVNLAAFFERISGNPSFRPTSKGHWLISLYGLLICVISILLFSIYVGIGVVVSQFIIFNLILRYKARNRLEGVWWGLLFRIVSWSYRRMQQIIAGSKNWRPIVGIFLFGDRNSAEDLRMADRIGNFKGMTMVSLLDAEHPDVVVRAVARADLPGGMEINTVMLPFDSRLNLVKTIGSLLDDQKNVLLFKSGHIALSASDRIDVWWKGEANGVLMALLSYIIAESDSAIGSPRKSIRLLRRLSEGESPHEARQELKQLMHDARLDGSIYILESEERPIHQTVREHSKDAGLMMIGMPGERVGGVARRLSLDNWLFVRQFENYDDMPPILFVKAAGTIDLLE